MKRNKTINTIIEVIRATFRHPSYIVIIMNKIGIPFLNDKDYINIFFKIRFGNRPNLNNPRTFNEKLQWLKLHDRKPIYTTMVDKYEVKKYVIKKLGKDYIIPTLGVYENFEDIDFDSLPNQFVIKCTHDSGGLIVCKDKTKINMRKTKKKIKRCLRRNFYWAGREWPYKNVKPRILIEQYMEDKEIGELKDYKFFCFNGKVRCFKIDFNRFINHQANYYDRNGKLLRFGEVICPPDFNKRIEMPVTLNKMIKLAEKLSKNTAFARIDFYSIGKKVYFGEITFYPAAGFGKFIPDEWDKKLGNMIDLSSLMKEES